MKIAMQRGFTHSELTANNWCLGVIGPNLDDRCAAAATFVRQQSSHQVSLEYNANTFQISVDGVSHNAESLETVLSAYTCSTILLESTSLGFVELFLALRAFVCLGNRSLSILYVEPKDYFSPRRGNILSKREFELSKEVAGFRAIPQATRLLSDQTTQHIVFFLGYEERRLDVALEDYQMIDPRHCSVVFGVPAFQAGWEMNSFANNVRVIKDKKLNSGGIHYCGAENPGSALRILEQIKDSLDPAEPMFIAPIGTKPHGVAAALFASTNYDCGILYDHPARTSQRSFEVARWHLYEVSFP
jgi:hypothetical protein